MDNMQLYPRIVSELGLDYDTEFDRDIAYLMSDYCCENLIDMPVEGELLINVLDRIDKHLFLKEVVKDGKGD